jgi:hypothetical protein
LTLSSYPNRTSPVKRGSYVLTNILGTPPPEPPPDVPALPENTGEKLSMRQQMERHRADSVCAGCHALFDPIGLVLERYDGIGRVRAEDNGNPVVGYGDTIHVLRDFGPIVGPVDLREPILRSVVRTAAEADYRFSSLVLAIVESEPFRMRIAGPEAGSTTAMNSTVEVSN